MTYTVSSGTLNPTQLNSVLVWCFIDLSVCEQDYPKSNGWMLMKFLKNVILDTSNS